MNSDRSFYALSFDSNVSVAVCVCVFVCLFVCLCALDQVSSTYKTDRHHIAEIWLKVALNTITLTLIKTWNHIGGVMVSLLPSSAVVHGFKHLCIKP
jgi:hypothetical protein